MEYRKSDREGLEPIENVVNYLRREVTTSRWLSLNALYERYMRELCVGKLTFTRFMSITRNAGMRVRRDPRRGRGGRFQYWQVLGVAPSTQREVRRSMPLNIGRTFNRWLDTQLNPGDLMPTRVLYRKFRTEYDVPGITSSLLSRQLDKDRFYVAPRKFDGKTVRCVRRIA